MSLCLFAGLILHGVGAAFRQGVSAWIGLGWGLTTWLALMSGHGAALTVVDWWQKDKSPGRIGVPMSGVAAIWCVFLATAALAVLLLRRLYAS
jgi:hypothetical protein